MIEKDVEKQIVEWAKSSGGIPMKLLAAGQRGWPDRIIFMPDGVLIIVEIKRPGGGRVSAQQLYWKRELERRRFPVLIARSLDEVKAAYTEGLWAIRD